MTTHSSDSMQRPRRADARRNYAHLLDVARVAFAERGADASLEDIARRAGVGIGTLYRHFPTRQALLEAVFGDRVEALCAEASDLLVAPSPGDALATWLRAVVRHITLYRGLAAALAPILDKESEPASSWHGAIHAAGAALLARAQQSGAVRPDIGVADLLKLANAIAVATEQAPESADRLLALVMDGLWRHEPPEGRR